MLPRQLMHTFRDVYRAPNTPHCSDVLSTQNPKPASRNRLTQLLKQAALVCSANCDTACKSSRTTTLSAAAPTKKCWPPFLRRRAASPQTRPRRRAITSGAPVCAKKPAASKLCCAPPLHGCKRRDTRRKTAVKKRKQGPLLWPHAPPLQVMGTHVWGRVVVKVADARCVLWLLQRTCRIAKIGWTAKRKNSPS